MITRIYIDNCKTFVNFEWKPQKLALLMGDNGTGKSSIAEVLWAIRAMVVDGEPVSRLFSGTTRTRWDKRLESRFEVDVFLDDAEDDPDRLYRYSLVIEHHPDRPALSRIKRESVDQGVHTLMEFIDGALELFRDDGSSVARLAMFPGKSALESIAPGNDNDRLVAFKRWFMLELMYVRPDPRSMSARTDEPFEVLDPSLSNFASWYPNVIAKDLRAAMNATRALQEVLPGFDSLRIGAGTNRLEAVFESEGGGSHAIDFDSLSDGQRQLSALYVFWQVAQSRGRTIIFDEPDNYVALREIQPWLLEVVERALADDGPQIWFISHHPEVLSQLAPSHGTRFYRHQGPTRIEQFKGIPGLSADEVVARGWDDE